MMCPMSIETKAKALSAAVSSFKPYEPELKDKMHRAGKAFLKAYATEVLKLRPDQYDLRSNKAGPAVSGEVTLHTDTLYVQAMEPLFYGNPCLLVRTCNGRKDYTGGSNRYLSPEALCNHIPR